MALTVTLSPACAYECARPGRAGADGGHEGGPRGAAEGPGGGRP